MVSSLLVIHVVSFFIGGVIMLTSESISEQGIVLTSFSYSLNIMIFLILNWVVSGVIKQKVINSSVYVKKEDKGPRGSSAFGGKDDVALTKQ